MNEQRRLVADVVGFSRLIGVDETGDGFLVEFKLLGIVDPNNIAACPSDDGGRTKRGLQI